MGECTFYGAGRKALDFDEEGSGFAYYPSGRVAVCALRGGMRLTFHADDASQRPLASFTNQGDGSVMLPDGRVCVVVNSAGGSVTDESGSIVQEWAWVVHGTPSGPARPVHVRVSPMFDFELKSRTDASMHFRPLGKRFLVGRRMLRKDTYLDRAEGRSADGRLRLRVDAPSLAQRQDAACKSADAARQERLRETQLHHWQLPRPAAGGRDSVGTQLPSSLSGVEQATTDILSRLAEGSLTTDISSRLEDLTTSLRPSASVSSDALTRCLRGRPQGAPLVERIAAQRAAHAKEIIHASRELQRTASSRRGGAALRVPSRRAHRLPPPPSVPTVSERALHSLLTDLAGADKLTAVCLSCGTSNDSRRMERLFGEVAAEWRRERASEGKKATPEPRASKAQAPSSRHATPSAADLDHAAGHVQGMRVQLVVGSCALSSGFPRRHGVFSFPMVCYVHRDRIVEINNRFASGGTDAGSFQRYLPTVARQAKRGVYEGRLVPPPARRAREDSGDAPTPENSSPTPSGD